MRKKVKVEIGGKKFKIVGVGNAFDISEHKGGRGGAQKELRLAVRDKNGKIHHYEWLFHNSKIAILKTI